MTSTSSRRVPRLVALTLAVVALGALALGAYWFQPWRLVTDSTVAEVLPGLPEAGADTTPQGPVVLAQGRLITHEHDTTGLVRLVRDSDGTLIVRIEGLETSDGPDLHVLVSDAPVLPGTDGWHVFDDGRHVDLGALKGNRGDANYPVPAGADISGLASVSIWCDRFDVSFGAAALTPAV